MATFISDDQIVSCIIDIIRNASSKVIIVSPYIKLHSRISEALAIYKKNPDIEITIVFGKNEDDMGKSLSAADAEFLKSLPNIKIYYKANLHAKYYANDSESLVTSMNLYSYSHNENKEMGIYVRTGVLGSSLYSNMQDYINELIDNAENLFNKKANFSTAFFSKYIDSEIVSDNFQIKSAAPSVSKDFDRPKTIKPSGYCIRTGTIIDFNLKSPFCKSAYESWSQFKNKEYPEKYCHYSGEASNGETSFSKPVLKKNWGKWG